MNALGHLLAILMLFHLWNVCFVSEVPWDRSKRQGGAALPRGPPLPPPGGSSRRPCPSAHPAARACAPPCLGPGPGSVRSAPVWQCPLLVQKPRVCRDRGCKARGGGWGVTCLPGIGCRLPCPHPGQCFGLAAGGRGIQQLVEVGVDIDCQDRGPGHLGGSTLPQESGLK